MRRICGGPIFTVLSAFVRPAAEVIVCFYPTNVIFFIRQTSEAIFFKLYFCFVAWLLILCIWTEVVKSEMLLTHPEDMYITEDDESQRYRDKEDSVDSTVDKSPRLRIAVQSTGK